MKRLLLPAVLLASTAFDAVLADDDWSIYVGPLSRTMYSNTPFAGDGDYSSGVEGVSAWYNLLHVSYFGDLDPVVSATAVDVQRFRDAKAKVNLAESAYLLFLSGAVSGTADEIMELRMESFQATWNDAHAAIVDLHALYSSAIPAGEPLDWDHPNP